MYPAPSSLCQPILSCAVCHVAGAPLPSETSSSHRPSPWANASLTPYNAHLATVQSLWAATSPAQLAILSGLRMLKALSGCKQQRHQAPSQLTARSCTATHMATWADCWSEAQHRLRWTLLPAAVLKWRPTVSLRRGFQTSCSYALQDQSLPSSTPCQQIHVIRCVHDLLACIACLVNKPLMQADCSVIADNIRAYDSVLRRPVDVPQVQRMAPVWRQLSAQWW
jgi:hypothetical protein